MNKDFYERIKVSKEVQDRINQVPEMIKHSKERIILAQDAIDETKDRIQETRKIIDIER